MKLLTASFIAWGVMDKIQLTQRIFAVNLSISPTFPRRIEWMHLILRTWIPHFSFILLILKAKFWWWISSFSYISVSRITPRLFPLSHDGIYFASLTYCFTFLDGKLVCVRIGLVFSHLHHVIGLLVDGRAFHPMEEQIVFSNARNDSTHLPNYLYLQQLRPGEASTVRVMATLRFLICSSFCKSHFVIRLPFLDATYKNCIHLLSIGLLLCRDNDKFLLKSCWEISVLWWDYRTPFAVFVSSATVATKLVKPRQILVM